MPSTSWNVLLDAFLAVRLGMLYATKVADSAFKNLIHLFLKLLLLRCSARSNSDTVVNARLLVQKDRVVSIEVSLLHVPWWWRHLFLLESDNICAIF